ncbi:MAG TPA: dienelactone hydrolase family protein [Allocoleopsis sp.]
MRPPTYLSDIQATIAYLQSLGNVQKEAIGSIGFCFGGHVVYLAATLPEIKATASFYSGGIATTAIGAGEPTITHTGEIKGTLYAFFGEQDSAIPLERVDQIADALNEFGIPHRIFRYSDAGHGFFCDKRASYNSDAATEAWAKVLDLFQ